MPYSRCRSAAHRLAGDFGRTGALAADGQFRADREPQAVDEVFQKVPLAADPTPDFPIGNPPGVPTPGQMPGIGMWKEGAY